MSEHSDCLMNMVVYVTLMDPSLLRWWQDCMGQQRQHALALVYILTSVESCDLTLKHPSVLAVHVCRW